MAAMEHHQNLEAFAFQGLGPHGQFEGHTLAGGERRVGIGLEHIAAIGHAVGSELQTGPVRVPRDLVGRGRPIEAQPEKEGHQNQRQVDADKPSSG